MDALKDVIQLASAGKIREAGSNARNELAIGRALDIGNAIPPEFRAAGIDFQRAANDFADIAARASEPPDAADWPKLMNGLAKIATQCNACHAAFRIK
jgi:cytochrome c556